MILIEAKLTRDVIGAFSYLRRTNLEVGRLLHFGPKPTFRHLICRNAQTNPPNALHPPAQAISDPG